MMLQILICSIFIYSSAVTSTTIVLQLYQQTIFNENQPHMPILPNFRDPIKQSGSGQFCWVKKKSAKILQAMPRLQAAVRPCNSRDLNSVLCLVVSYRVVDALTNLKGNICCSSAVTLRSTFRIGYFCIFLPEVFLLLLVNQAQLGIKLLLNGEISSMLKLGIIFLNS